MDKFIFKLVDAGGSFFDSSQDLFVSGTQTVVGVETPTITDAIRKNILVKVGPAKAEKVAEASATDEPTAAELKAALDALGVEYKGNASKADLKALLEEAQIAEAAKQAGVAAPPAGDA